MCFGQAARFDNFGGHSELQRKQLEIEEVFLNHLSQLRIVVWGLGRSFDLNLVGFNVLQMGRRLFYFSSQKSLALVAQSFCFARH